MSSTKALPSVFISASFNQLSADSGYYSELKERFPKLAEMEGANCSIFITDLVPIGIADRAVETRAADGSIRPFYFSVGREGAEKALDSIVSKPVHVSQNYRSHYDGDPNSPEFTPIGVHLGAMIANRDGVDYVRVVQSLWEGDFPDQVAFIRSNQQAFGASYESSLSREHVIGGTGSENDPFILGTGWKFTGSALLFKESAAYRDAQLLHAHLCANFLGVETEDSVDDNEGKRPSKKFQRVYIGASSMPRQLELCTDCRPKVQDALLAGELVDPDKITDTDAFKELVSERATLQEQLNAKETELEDAKAAHAKEVEDLQTELTSLKDEKASIEASAAVEKWAADNKDYFTEEGLKEAKDIRAKMLRNEATQEDIDKLLSLKVTASIPRGAQSDKPGEVTAEKAKELGSAAGVVFNRQDPLRLNKK